MTGDFFGTMDAVRRLPLYRRTRFWRELRDAINDRERAIGSHRLSYPDVLMFANDGDFELAWGRAATVIKADWSEMDEARTLTMHQLGV